MNKILLIACGFLATFNLHAQTTQNIQMVPFTKVHLNDAFWTQRLRVMKETTIPYAFKKMKDGGYIRNFEIAGKILSGEIPARQEKFQSNNVYDDADLYKVIEGASYILSMEKDEKLENGIDSMINLVASAQEPDGYLQTNWTINNPRHEWYGGQQWMMDWNLSHETFNIGELIEAAVAYHDATGKDKLLKVAIKGADLICKRFNENGIKMAPGHAVIEMALVRLYEKTGDVKYLNEALFFLNCRGIRKFDPASSDMRVNGRYWQDHLPAIQQREAFGHAVRAMYFYSGMADIVRLKMDKQYETALNAIWDNIVSKKYYITGGLGARDVNEAFGDDYELPNAQAYCETCASLANCMFNLRMFRLYGDAKYFDIIERSLYNATLSGLSMDGTRFFYANRLEATRGQDRSEWFGTSCCPTNLCRIIPAVPGYFFATDQKAIYANLFASNTSNVDFNGKNVSLIETTGYPWDGNVKITIDKTATSQFMLKIRIPGWAVNKPVASDLYTYKSSKSKKVVITINGKPYAYQTDKGYAIVNRAWKAGDIVEINLPMDVHMVKANEKVKADNGLVSVERGPIVYCAEAVDNGNQMNNLYLPASATFTTGTNVNNDDPEITLLTATAKRIERHNNKLIESNTVLKMIPYYYRSHRGTTLMSVWLPDNANNIKEHLTYIDKVEICNQDSEKAHNLQGKNMNADASLGWRDARDGYISYDLQIDPHKTNELVLTYWGNDDGNRSFDLLVDGTKFASETVNRLSPNEYCNKHYVIPINLTTSKNKINIRLQSHTNNDIVGGIFGIKTIVKN